MLLPEFAMVEPLWQDELFDASRWESAQALSEVWRHRLPELGVAHVVGTLPATIDGRPFNQGFLWSTSGGPVPLRSKFYLPDEPGTWEARGSTGVIPTSPNTTPGPSTAAQAPVGLESPT